MFDSAAAEDNLYCISKKQIHQFLDGPERDDVYGIGFFCDAFTGSVLLVANTQRSHLRTLLDCGVHFAPKDDPEAFKWDIGNWQYPAGLFPSSSAEQSEFDEGWRGFRESLSNIECEEDHEYDEKQRMLENVCVKVLRRVIRDGIFSDVAGLQGVTILGDDSLGENVIEKKKLLCELVGNPCRPVTLEAEWLTTTVKSLAETIYNDSDFERMPILADALEDAGCNNADILNHLRQPGVHVRGCWALDLVLAKE